MLHDDMLEAFKHFPLRTDGRCEDHGLKFCGECADYDGPCDYEGPACGGAVFDRLCDIHRIEELCGHDPDTE